MIRHIILAAATASFAASAYADDMFVGVQPVPDQAQGDGPGIDRVLFDELNSDIMLMSPGETVSLPSLGGQTLEAELDRIAIYDHGMRAWVGRLEGKGLESRVIMTETNGFSFGRIQTPEGTWHVIPSFDGSGHEIMRHPDNAVNDHAVDDAIVPDLDEVLASAAAHDHGHDHGPHTDDAAPVFDSPDVAIGSLGTLDIIVFYSTSFTDLWGLASGGRIQYLIALLDQAMVDSDTGMRARLAAAEPVTVDETASNSSSLTDLQDGAGDGIAGPDQDFSAYLARRTAVGADVAVLLRRHFKDTRVGGSCGVGYVLGGGLGTVDPYAAFAMNVSSDWIDGDDTDLGNGYSFCSDYTMPHETGHNLGDAHNVEDQSAAGLFAYSNGHRVDCEFTTIMAYDSAGSVDCGGADAPGPGNEAEIGYFSNPDISLCPGGVACGIDASAAGNVGAPLDDTTETDNARSMRVEGHDVTEFYAEVRALRSALLPVSRSVTNGSPATAFVSVINPAAGSVTATGCGLRLPGAAPSEFTYRAWDGSSFTAAADTEVSISPGGVQDFVIAVESATTFEDDVTSAVSSDNDETELYIEAYCDNRRSAEYTSGLNSLFFSSSAGSVADIIALAATLPAAPGYVELPTTGTFVGVFSVAISNVGSGATITASMDTGSTTIDGIDSMTICPTDSGGACTSARSSTATFASTGGSTATFAVFVKGDGSTVSNSPRDNRVFVRFAEAGTVRGATSVAVCTEGAGGAC